ncbi:MAG TPA: hypothetical protein VGV12_07090 [Gemmatimonadales bacterium]|nr:hypothetical protein [Gemmatimonadales bacterium]
MTARHWIFGVEDVGDRRAAVGRWLRGFGSNLLLGCVSLGVAFGLGEGLVRLVAPQQLIIKRPDIWEAVDTLGWVQRPDINTTINTGEGTVRLITDREGYRVGTAGRIEGAKRILLLGDSFMEALQVEYEQSLAGLLEARLTPRLGEQVAVRNTGVGAWDPPQYLVAERRALARESFDLVLVSLYLGNDVVPRRIDRFPPRAPVEVHHLRWPRRWSGGELIDAVLYPINDYLEVRSQLFVFVKTRMETIRSRLGLTGEEFPVDLLRREASSPRWAVTAEICRDIRDAAVVHQIPVLFVLVPAPYQVDSADFAHALADFKIDPAAVDLDQPERLLSDAMRVYRLPMIDVLPDFRRSSAAGSHLYGNVDRHLSTAGHDLLERLVEPAVVSYLTPRQRRP